MSGKSATLPRRAAAARPETVGDWIDHAASTLRQAGLAFGHGTHYAEDEAAWLVTHTLGIAFETLGEAYARPVPVRTGARIQRLMDERIRTRAPLAYLIREAWLGDHRFYVDERTIVPRSFIAELLRDQLAPWIASPAAVRSVLDLCTGSGCLAVLAGYAFPQAKVDAVDLSASALEVARRNIGEHGMAGRIRLLESDLFARVRKRRYDVIISNPPYVDAKSMRTLPEEYRHEPEMALASGEDGLEITRRILAEARDRLSPDGVLVVEVGHNRKVLERTMRGLPFHWARTSGGRNFVFVLRREELPAAATASGSAASPKGARRSVRSR